MTPAPPDLIDAYLYSRVSTRKQLTGLGMELQDKNTVACLAEHPEWRLAGSFRDLGISAFKGANRLEGEFGEFLEKVKTGKVKPGSILIVYSLDRITRDNIIEAQGLLLDLLRADIVICTTIDRMVFSRNDDPKTVLINLIVSLLTMVRANEESQTKSDRGKDIWNTKRERARDGVTMSANLPGWLYLDENRKPLANPTHAATVLRMFELYDLGHGYATIMHTLDAEKMRSFGRSSRWSPAYIRQVLSNRAAIGEKQAYLNNYDTDKKSIPVGLPIPDAYPVVVPPALFRRVEARLAGNKPRERSGNLRNLFGGLCRCVHCRGRMDIVPHSKNKALHYLRCYNRYVTKTCSLGGNYAYESFEATALGALIPVLTDDQHSSRDTATELIGLRDRLVEAEAARARLYSLHSAGNDDPLLLGLITDALSTAANLRDQIARSELINDRAHPSMLAADVARNMRDAALRQDPVSRKAIAVAIAPIVSLVGFGDYGLIIVEIADGESFIGIQRGEHVFVMERTETGEYELKVRKNDSKWTWELVTASIRKLADLLPGIKTDAQLFRARLARERARYFERASSVRS